METVYKKLIAQYKKYAATGEAAGRSQVLAFRDVLPPNMTKAEAIAMLEDAIETINGFTAKLKAINGYSRDPELKAQTAINARYITRYSSEISLYKNSTEEHFQKTFPSSTFSDMCVAVCNLERACEHFVLRGPRFYPK